MATHRVVRGGALVVAATMVWHVSNFAFNSIAARVLGPAEYGTLAAIIALLYGASPVMYSVQTVASKLTTSLGERDEWSRVRALAWFYGVRLAGAGLLTAALIALFSGALARFLRVPSGVPIAMLGIALMVWLPVSLQRGVLQGAMRYRAYASNVLAESGVKLGAAVLLLVWLWATVEGAILAVVVAASAALLVNAVLVRALPRPDAEARPISHPYRYSVLTLVCLTLLAVMLSVDILAARRYLDAETAGLYAALSLAGKTVFFATSALSLVLFPWFSSRREKGLDARLGLRGGLSVIGAVSLGLLTIFFLLPTWVVGPLFGADYLTIDGHLGWMGLAFAFYALLYLVCMYLLSQATTFGAYALATGLTAQLGGLYVFHSSISQIIAVEVVVFGALALFLGGYALRRVLSGDQRVPAGEAEADAEERWQTL